MCLEALKYISVTCMGWSVRISHNSSSVGIVAFYLPSSSSSSSCSSSYTSSSLSSSLSSSSSSSLSLSLLTVSLVTFVEDDLQYYVICFPLIASLSIFAPEHDLSFTKLIYTPKVGMTFYFIVPSACTVFVLLLLLSFVFSVGALRIYFCCAYLLQCYQAKVDSFTMSIFSLYSCFYVFLLFTHNTFYFNLHISYYCHNYDYDYFY